jgi:hypothetical protein
VDILSDARPSSFPTQIRGRGEGEKERENFPGKSEKVFKVGSRSILSLCQILNEKVF